MFFYEFERIVDVDVELQRWVKEYNLETLDLITLQWNAMVQQLAFMTGSNTNGNVWTVEW